MTYATPWDASKMEHGPFLRSARCDHCMDVIVQRKDGVWRHRGSNKEVCA
jgi:hypothetical protein